MLFKSFVLLSCSLLVVAAPAPEQRRAAAGKAIGQKQPAVSASALPRPLVLSARRAQVQALRQAAASTSVASGNDAAANSTNSGDAQSSLTLLQSVIATGFENDGQQPPVAGQSPSLTSGNNFINFCATVPGKPITNGQQIKTGSCNPAPMGIIAATTNMPSSKFVFPKNTDSIPANTSFTVRMALNNLQAGTFVNAQANYYSAPQQVNGQGAIIGHTHVVIEKLTSLDQTTPTDPNVFAFFKGVNSAQTNGEVTVDLDNGLPAGFYRIASINSAANHQPVLVAVAQHGSLDDMAYFTVTDSGAAAGNATATTGTAAVASTAAAGNATTVVGTAAVASTASANSTVVAGASTAAAAKTAIIASSTPKTAGTGTAFKAIGGKKN
ncbi:hypothetical protein HETIRDRAFT_444640 [Heterobasidion irregulare TC 32-1]|uniref:Uncharacterized protein n=1 Tax=Heterobasidion irregulare (strain TC 32-1) TaxID=747525 RepID=W4KD75_HETIT|nr:uncharacterized protein HETIRDRAFT_444640 [Heterobasidion irregulare TC 32-1]ETW83270.1 hypothetical protein HETIRDRAFT_444640 [Heterobasidion irregulare TC 32-1]